MDEFHNFNRRTGRDSSDGQLKRICSIPTRKEAYEKFNEVYRCNMIKKGVDIDEEELK